MGQKYPENREDLRNVLLRRAQTMTDEYALRRLRTLARGQAQIAYRKYGEAEYARWREIVDAAQVQLIKIWRGEQHE